KPSGRLAEWNSALRRSGSYMTEDELGHLEHADAVFSIKDLFQLIVCFDEGFVRGILKVVASDVVPQLPSDFRPRERFTADNLGQLVVWFDRLHESRAGLPFAFGFARLSHIMLRFDKRTKQATEEL